MIQIIYSSIIIILLLTILILMRKIWRIKSEHHQKLAKLYTLLTNIDCNDKKYLQKANLEDNLNKKMSEARKQISMDIFELQMDIFKKITEK